MKKKEVSPCINDGGQPGELESFKGGYHKFEKCLLFGRPVILCDFCSADIPSQYEEFGLSSAFDIDSQLKFLEYVKISPKEKFYDYVCPKCHERHGFQKIVLELKKVIK